MVRKLGLARLTEGNISMTLAFVLQMVSCLVQLNLNVLPEL
uniref:Uncharacterized protein n=1 Tax=Arundo donax TaxID=35708 RepID=A0A0A9F6X4_ARUDO